MMRSEQGMESINFNINEIENYGIEVTSVSSFIEEVNKRRAGFNRRE